MKMLAVRGTYDGKTIHDAEGEGNNTPRDEP